MIEILRKRRFDLGWFCGMIVGAPIMLVPSTIKVVLLYCLVSGLFVGIVEVVTREPKTDKPS